MNFTTSLSVPLPVTPILLGKLGLIQGIDGSVAAGFPSPAADYAVDRIDLLQQLIQHPQATFFMRVRGNSMVDYGIFDKDVVVIDRAIKAQSGHIVVAVLDNEFTVKLLHINKAGRVKLKVGNTTMQDIVPKEGQELVIWGVVKAALKLFT